MFGSDSESGSSRDRPPLTETFLELCETCLERGRERPGIHRVGNGWLCGPCWRGDGTASEHSAIHDAPRQREVRRSYRRRNLEKLREYQRLYRARQRMRARLIDEENRAGEDS